MSSTNHALEQIPVRLFDDADQAATWVAHSLCERINKVLSERAHCVLALPTGETPRSVYSALIALYQAKKISFSRVHIFMLDEYYPMPPAHALSFYHFIQAELISHIDLPATHFHYLDGSTPESQIAQHCKQYEADIYALGGIDITLLGIGTNGHIAFNEPGAHLKSTTRRVVLRSETRSRQVDIFGSEDVPYAALTVGISTILESRFVMLLAFGNKKAAIVKESIEGSVSDTVPASMLQLHAQALCVLDAASASELTRLRAPWLGGPCVWDLPLMKKAVISLALTLKKPILSLTREDYLAHGLQGLVRTQDAYEINMKVFYALRDSITGWPGGKPSPLPNHPERESPYPKKVLIFSPHPDDDIISMGGTFMRLHDQGHDVHVAYQTSGNIAVTDEFVTRFLDFSAGFQTLFSLDTTLTRKMFADALSLAHKKENLFARDREDVRAIKGLIRRCEARATCRYVGIKEENIHFQNLPFYETGEIKKAPPTEVDFAHTVDLLEKIKPHQIYCAGDLADPHGTHKVCIEIIFEALARLKKKNAPWLADCWVWLYKGAWQEWAMDEIEMAIPMSPDQVRKKRFGIFIHQSQKDIVPFQGSDSREFWQRAEDRNKNTANLYSALGLTQYAAMEAFKRYHF